MQYFHIHFELKNKSVKLRLVLSNELRLLNNLIVWSLIIA